MTELDVSSKQGIVLPSLYVMREPSNGETKLRERCNMDGHVQHEKLRKISIVSLNREPPNGITKPKETNYPNGHAHHEIPRGDAEGPLSIDVKAGIELFKGVTFRKGTDDHEVDEPLLKFTREPKKETNYQNGHAQLITLSQDDKHIPNGATPFADDRQGSCFDKHGNLTTKTTKLSRVKNCLKNPIISTVITLLSVGMCITSIVLVVTSPPIPQPRTCVECAALNRTDNSGTALRETLKTVYQDGKELCCAENNEQLSDLIDFTVKEQTAMPAFEKNVNITPYSISNASMHMKLVPSYFDEDKFFDVPQFHPTNFDLHFEPDEHNPLLEHRRNVEVSSEGVTIQVPGLYLVYSSVHFKPESALPCKMYDKKTWSLNIQRTMADKPTPDTILTATHTCRDECTRNEQTGYTAGVFVVHANDVIKVDLSGERLVSYRPESTYFGLTMLGKLA